ncbi:sensor histidine kinase [Maritalea sp.]|uniref:sensor histidine kinase n=1 Tax=Maritalea sp. TaxID=2003361 RepID=UPI003EF1EB55
MIKHSLTWERQQKDLVEQRDYLTFGLLRTGICVMLQNEDFEYEYIANLPKAWSSPPDASPPSDISLFGADLADKLKIEKENLLATGEKREFEWTTTDGFTFQFIIELVFDRGDHKEIFTAVKDLTAERQRENMLHTLLKEVSHRSKNLLAMVQSIAFQTARNSESIDWFMDRFSGRVQSLSFSQDAITQTDWQGSHVEQLVEKQKTLFSRSVQKLVHFEGENPLLSPNATMHLGLAIHELISNAANFGTFIERNDKIVIDFRTNDNGAESQNVTFLWHEKRSPNSTKMNAFGKKQFSSVLLEQVVPSAVSGHAELVIEDDSIVYKLKFPKFA